MDKLLLTDDDDLTPLFRSCLTEIFKKFGTKENPPPNFTSEQ